MSSSFAEMESSFLVTTVLPLSLFLVPLCVGIVQHFSSPGTSLGIRLLAIISFWLGFSGIVLLPLDLTIASSTSTDDNESDAATPETNATYVPWMITYWSSFILAFVILPIVRKFLRSGHFTVWTRLSDAFYSSIRCWAIMLGLLLVAILILAVKLHKWNVVPILMTIGNTYGLLLVALLLGYGLVDVPRQMWRVALPEKELRRTQILANAADEALFEAVWELQDVEDDIDQAVRSIRHVQEDGILLQSLGNKIQDDNVALDSFSTLESSYYQYCTQKLVHRRNQTALLDAELQSRRMKRRDRFRQRDTTQRDEENTNSHESGKFAEDEQVPTIPQLAQLHARLKAAQVKLESAEQSWTECVERSKFYEAMMEETSSLIDTSLLPTASLVGGSNNAFSSAQAKLRHLWITRLIKPFSITSSCIFAALSIMVLWSEATMSLPWNLSPFAFILSMAAGETKGFLFACLALLPLLYMSACVYTSIFKMSFFGPNCLRGCKQSSGAALIFNAQYLIRMQFPLGYNYLLMLKYHTDDTNCSFAAIMKHMSTVPFFGTSFSVYAPLLILALCGFTLCNGYPRLLGILGLEHEDAILLGDRETLDRKVAEGEVLLRRHAQRREGSAKAPISANAGFDRIGGRNKTTLSNYAASM
jgi:hypothetical protein